jgi:DNA-binding NarL/FixJ family response regulator
MQSDNPAPSGDVSGSKKIRVLVVDDHPVVRLGLRSLVEAQADMEVVADAADAQEAVRATATHHPDIILLDLRMPGMDGADAITALLKVDPGAKVIVVTTYDGDEDVYRAVQAGARGYLLKDTFAQGMLEGIRSVAAGGQLFPPAVASKLAERQSTTSLTPREVVVLQLLAKGLTNKEIQLALGIAEGTLKNHLKHIFEKLKVRTRSEAILVALRRGIVRFP